MPVLPRLIAAALVAGCVQTSTAAAEVTLPAAAPGAPASDLDLIRQKAGSDRVLRSYLSMIHHRAATPEGRSEIEQQMLSGLPASGAAADFPVALGNTLGLEAAQERSRFVAEALAADIDGNWEVTLEETRLLLQSGRNEGSAAAFILSDTDGNGILTMDEIKAAAVAQRQNRPGRGGPVRSK